MRFPWSKPKAVRPDRKPDAATLLGLVCSDVYKDNPEFYHVACKVRGCTCSCHKQGAGA